MDTDTPRQQAKEAKAFLDRLVLENESLRRQLATAQQQLEILQRSGSSLGPETAKAWAKALEAADPRAWRELRTGTFEWNDEQGFPTGGGLCALIQHLTALPEDDSCSRLLWDSQENQRERWRNEAIAKGETTERYQRRPYPPRFRNQYAVSSVFAQQGKQGLATTVRQLTAGLRDGSKAKLLVEASFALWQEEAVAKLNGDPLVALKELKAAVREATEPSLEHFTSGFFNGGFFSAAFGLDRRYEIARDTLGVSAEASPAEIRTAYRRLARVHHPDAGGDAEQFSKVAAAYELLTA